MPPQLPPLRPSLLRHLLRLDLCLWHWPKPRLRQLPQSARTPGSYTVQMGDSWISVAARTGVSVAELQAANPRSMRANEWLIVGETLVIPGETAPAAGSGTVTGTAGVTQTGGMETAAQTYVVQAGESWNSIAAKFNTTKRLLQAANPLSIRYGEVLFRGEKLIIPPPGTTDTDIERATTTPTSTVTAQITATVSVEASRPKRHRSRL